MKQMTDKPKKKVYARAKTGGLTEINYTKGDEPVSDNEHSTAFKQELYKWQANPRKYWWEHGGSRKVLIAITVIIVVSLVMVFLI